MSRNKQPTDKPNYPDYPELKKVQIHRRRFLSIVSGSAATAVLFSSCKDKVSETTGGAPFKTTDDAPFRTAGEPPEIKLDKVDTDTGPAFKRNAGLPPRPKTEPVDKPIKKKKKEKPANRVNGGIALPDLSD